MIKTLCLCDGCNTELPLPQEKTIRARNGNKYGVEITTFSIEDTSESSSVPIHLCKYCIVDLIVRELDDRSKCKEY